MPSILVNDYKLSNLLNHLKYDSSAIWNDCRLNSIFYKINGVEFGQPFINIGNLGLESWGIHCADHT